MVRAVLSGSKTQTRRVVKYSDHIEQFERGKDGGFYYDFLDEVDPAYVRSRDVPCPYGQPGDKLWVREAWRTEPAFDALPPRDLDPAVAPVQYEAGPHADVLGGKLRPSMFMPRWASRITLEVTGVRVERLQDISEADCRAEGITDGGCTSCGMPEPCGCHAPSPSARDAYAHLWMSINGPDSWALNPWVWCIEFRRITPTT